VAKHNALPIAQQNYMREIFERNMTSGFCPVKKEPVFQGFSYITDSKKTKKLKRIPVFVRFW